MLDLADLPPAIVSALQTFAERLAQHIRTHPEASLAAHEQGVLDAWRASAPAVLEGTLQATTAGLDPRVRPLRARCPQCGTARPFLDQRGRALQTRVGPIGFTRPWYHCPPCHRGWSPSDRTLGIGAYERASAGVRRWAAELGAAHTFAEAQARLADLAGVSLGQETVRTYAEAVGAQVEAAQQAAITHVLDEQEPLPETTDPAPGDLVVETDGVYVRYREPGAGRRRGLPRSEAGLGRRLLPREWSAHQRPGAPAAGPGAAQLRGRPRDGGAVRASAAGRGGPPWGLGRGRLDPAAER